VAEPLLWAYGVMRRADTPPTGAAGLAGGTLERVEEGGLAALVSAVPADRFSGEALKRTLEDLEALETLARGHAAVQDAALRAGDLLPFRMCTLYRSRAGVRDMLAGEAPRLTRALERLHGRVEWGVKGFAAAAHGVTPRARPASGAEYLARRQAERRSAATQDDALAAAAADVHARLAQQAVAAALGTPQDRRLSGRDAEMVLNASYLVDRDRAEEFAGLVRTLDGRGLALELTGPWPPFHFVAEPA
jgi:Gas vesicle synthesis protein GvpL/GvpF